MFDDLTGTTKDYNSVMCKAPFAAMYFSVNGEIMPCCYNRHQPQYIPGYIQNEKNILDVWRGEKWQALRFAVHNNDFSKGCVFCHRDLSANNQKAFKGNLYRDLHIDKNYPTRMDFELSNKCNLSCVMCQSSFSSKIFDKNNKKRYLNHYDKSFVDSLDEFIPYLECAVFLGGEPFLIDIYYDIWGKITKINPKCNIIVQTNGTILNKKVKDILGRGRFEISFSLDSLKEKVYEKIRIGAEFKKVMSNLMYFKNYCNENKTQLSITPCIMKQNWKELPAFIDFCNEHGIRLYFHKVSKPNEFSLRRLSSRKINRILKKYQKIYHDKLDKMSKDNKLSVLSLIEYLKEWLIAAKKRENRIWRIRFNKLYFFLRIFLNKKNKRFKRVHIEVGKSICNQQCIFCYLDNKYYKKNFSLELLRYFDDIVAFCKKNKVIELFIQGGEPTIIPGVYECFKKIADRTDTVINIVTNGKKFDQKWIDLFARRGGEANFSLNSPNTQTFQKICPGGDLLKSIENVIRFQVAKEKYPEPRCLTLISMVVCTETITELVDFYDLAIQLKVDTVKYYADISSSYRINIDDPNFKKIAHASFEKLLSKIAENPVVNCYELETLARCIGYNKPIPDIDGLNISLRNRMQEGFNSVILPKTEKSICSAPWNSIFIDDDLNVFPCCHSKVSWGNLKDTSLKKILKGKKIKEMKKDFLDGIFKGCSLSCPDLPV